GKTLRIEIQPEDADSGHQAFTLWDMALCVSKDDQGTSRYVTGSIHVTMNLVRGYPILPEPAHPYYWSNGTTAVVISSAKKTFTATYDTTRSQYRGAFFVKPAPPVLVPPGT